MYKKLAAVTVGLTSIIGVAKHFENRDTNVTSSLIETSDLYSLPSKFYQTSYGLFNKIIDIGHAKAALETIVKESIREGPLSKLEKRNEIMKHGYPTLDNIIQYDDHILAYSNYFKGPLWVCEHLTPTRVTNNDNVTRQKSEFQSDNSILQIFRTSNQDFYKSGYDRGHLAAAANHRQSQISMDDTFYLTNICPQIGKGLNRTKWNALEKRARALARKHGSVHVLTGPLYLPTVEGKEKFVKFKLIGDSNVAVPTHFFKAMVSTSRNGEYHLEAYVMPNEEIREDLPCSTFLVPKIAIEKGTGFLVFDMIPHAQYKTINGFPNPLYKPQS